MTRKKKKIEWTGAEAKCKNSVARDIARETNYCVKKCS
jgi:hypothetical protein